MGHLTIPCPQGTLKQSYATASVAAPEIFCGGASRGQNAILRGQKSKNLPKMADFGHFFLLTGGASGGTASDWGAFAPPLMPPLHCIEDGQNKKSHLLFSFLVRSVLFLHFTGGIYFAQNNIPSFHWRHLNNYTPHENKCFYPRNQNHRVACVTRVNSVCVQTRHAIHGVHTR